MSNLEHSRTNLQLQHTTAESLDLRQGDVPGRPSSLVPPPWPNTPHTYLNPIRGQSDEGSDTVMKRKQAQDPGFRRGARAAQVEDSGGPRCVNAGGSLRRLVHLVPACTTHPPRRSHYTILLYAGDDPGVRGDHHKLLWTVRQAMRCGIATLWSPVTSMSGMILGFVVTIIRCSALCAKRRDAG
ncbi:hypothetical protein Bbelb_216760 [Branchiostoma belcheri]|nr:hypothetical protein Bbelb_216760 [Branchiostoma belcheri]